MDVWLRFVLAVLATWRITHGLAREDGPGDVVARLRARLGDGFTGQLMDCFYCLSLWVAAPLAFFVGREPIDVILAWLALSGGACLLERVGQDPVVIQPLSHLHEPETSDGMLRSETNKPPGPTAAPVAGATPAGASAARSTTT